MKHKISLKEIKNFLQENSGVPDIGIKERNRYIADLRKAYCALAKVFTTASLDEIGATIRPEFKHDGVLYNLDKFNQIYPTGGLECSDIYTKAFEHFSSINGSIPILSNDVEIIKRSYNKKMNAAINKFFVELEKRDNKITKLTQQNLKLKYKISIFNKTIFGRI